MYGCESWTVKKAEHQRIDAFELWCWRSPLDCKQIQPVHSEGDQPWEFFGRNDAKAETPVLWPPHAKSWLIGKDSDAGRDSGQEEKGMTEDEMAGWHHWLGGRESEWTPGVGDRQGGLACCSSWGRKESDMTEDWTELPHKLGLVGSLNNLAVHWQRLSVVLREHITRITKRNRPRIMANPCWSLFLNYEPQLPGLRQLKRPKNAMAFGYDI